MSSMLTARLAEELVHLRRVARCADGVDGRRRLVERARPRRGRTRRHLGSRPPTAVPSPQGCTPRRAGATAQGGRGRSTTLASRSPAPPLHRARPPRAPHRTGAPSAPRGRSGRRARRARPACRTRADRIARRRSAANLPRSSGSSARISDTSGSSSPAATPWWWIWSGESAESRTTNRYACARTAVAARAVILPRSVSTSSPGNELTGRRLERRRSAWSAQPAPNAGTPRSSRRCWNPVPGDPVDAAIVPAELALLLHDLGCVEPEQHRDRWRAGRRCSRTAPRSARSPAPSRRSPHRNRSSTSIGCILTTGENLAAASAMKRSTSEGEPSDWSSEMISPVVSSRTQQWATSRRTDEPPRTSAHDSSSRRPSAHELQRHEVLELVARAAFAGELERPLDPGRPTTSVDEGDRLLGDRVRDVAPWRHPPSFSIGQRRPPVRSCSDMTCDPLLRGRGRVGAAHGELERCRRSFPTPTSPGRHQSSTPSAWASSGSRRSRSSGPSRCPPMRGSSTRRS